MTSLGSPSSTRGVSITGAPLIAVTTAKRGYDERRRIANKDWYNRMVADPERYARFLKGKRDWNAAHSRSNPNCAACGEPKPYRHRNCTACREAFIEWSKVAYANKRAKNGWKKDAKLAYERRVAKYGREALAAQARALYARRQEREKQREESTRTNGAEQVAPVGAKARHRLDRPIRARDYRRKHRRTVRPEHPEVRLAGALQGHPDALASGGEAAEHRFP